MRLPSTILLLLLVAPLVGRAQATSMAARMIGLEPGATEKAKPKSKPKGYWRKLWSKVGKKRIVINIPARRLRLYDGETLEMDVPAAIGRLTYPGVKGNTRTRIGSYRISSWHEDYRSKDYPTRWSHDPWRGAFGKFTAKLGPRASYQYIHGTVGPEELGDWLIEKLPVPPAEEGDTAAAHARRSRGAERGLSHGCVRISNRNITRLRELAPLGTPVEKVYCLTERRPGPEGTPVDISLPNVYRYKELDEAAIYHVASGKLEGYRHPGDAVGPR